MNEEFKCPLVQQQEAEEPTPEPTPIPVCDDSELVIMGRSFKGLRTFSIILLIMVVYSYLTIKNNDVMGMRDLALMACGFLFGVKTVTQKR
jgi:hypothetical protein